MLAIPYHFLIVAILVPLQMLAANSDLFTFHDTYRTFVINLSFSFILFLAMYSLFRDKHRSALAASVSISFIFTFSTLNRVLFDFQNGMMTLLIVIVLILTGLIIIYRTRIGSSKTTVIINAFLIAVVLVPTLKLANSQFRSASVERSLYQRISLPEENSLGSSYPNIIHLVLDGYAREDLLQSLFGIDNSVFLNDLQQMGFYVADQAVSPYGQTVLTMNAILSLDYLDNIRSKSVAEIPDIDGKQFRKILMNQLEYAPVLQTLRSRGYQIVTTKVDYPPVQIDTADYKLKRVNHFNKFESLVYGFTPVYRILAKLFDFDKNSNRDNIIFALDPNNIEKLKNPFFLYNHVITPHPPFGIDQGGNERITASGGLSDGDHFLENDPDRFREYRDGYSEKVHWTNGAVTKYIRKIINSSEGPTIILVHADHGSGLYLNHESADKSCLKERFSVLFAVYDSENQLQGMMNPDFNLVNTYRILFDRIFEAKLALLESHSYFAPWSKPMEFKPISTVQLAAECRRNSGAQLTP